MTGAPPIARVRRIDARAAPHDWRWAEANRAAIEANGNESGLLWEAVAMARVAEARGDAAQVVASLGVLAELTADLALPEGVQPWRADLVEALVADGDLARAESEADALAARLVGGGSRPSSS